MFVIHVQVPVVLFEKKQRLVHVSQNKSGRFRTPSARTLLQKMQNEFRFTKIRNNHFKCKQNSKAPSINRLGRNSMAETLKSIKIKSAKKRLRPL